MPNPLLDISSLPRFNELAPDQVVPALSELIAEHRQKLFDTLVAPLEEMEHELSRVWSPVSHLQGVLESLEWREAYNAALPLLTEHGTEHRIITKRPAAARLCRRRTATARYRERCTQERR